MKNNSWDTLSRCDRPNAMTYIDLIFQDFVELSGDRLYGDDTSLVCGIAMLKKIPVTIIGQLRGGNLQEQIQRNFSMAYPEGYRKSMRLMRQAEKFNRPVICFVDTIGAYPGLEAEERGQSAAIADQILTMLGLQVPIVSILIGHGGSGGALAFCAADRIAILENAVLSVISPKACAEILWKDISRANEAAQLLKMTSTELLEQGLVDRIIPEPAKGAYGNAAEMASQIEEYLSREIRSLERLSPKKLVRQRKRKFRSIGVKGISH